MGFKPSQEKEFEKLTVKHKALNAQTPNFINISDSLHSNAVQRSKYVQVDSTLMYDIHLQPEKLQKFNFNSRDINLAPGETQDDLNSMNQVFLRFCMTDEVNRKRQIFCLFKATFQAKMIKIRNQGQKLQTMEML